jgi:hypothetical protein
MLLSRGAAREDALGGERPPRAERAPDEGRVRRETGRGKQVRRK